MIHSILREKSAQFFLMYSNSVNFYYATKFKTHDPAIYLIGEDGTELIVVSEMEKKRVEEESKVKEIASFEDLGYKEKLRELKDSKRAFSEMVVELLKTHKAKKVLIPHELPAFLAVSLSENFEIEVIEDPFIKIRAIKRGDEIEKIREVCNALIDVFDKTVKNFKFKSCEEVRNFIELNLFERGYLAEDTIVSTGKQTAIPHHRGHGKIEEHLVIDVFPRSREHLYYSDFTRTVFLEKNQELEDMYKAVVEAQERAISMIKDGVNARDVHTEVKQVLEDFGYKTTKTEGFIHSTGHGIGLEIHEEPRISDCDIELKSGMVFTVEPGLYYKDIGGVRVEDVVVVRKNGCEVLTNYEKFIRL